MYVYSTCVYIYIYVCMYTRVCRYIYIYIYRERERERASDVHLQIDVLTRSLISDEGNFQAPESNLGAAMEKGLGFGAWGWCL